MRLNVLLLAVFAASLTPLAGAQVNQGIRTGKDPVTPPASHYRDGRTGISFQVPAGWNLDRKDGSVSTFHLDARSAPRTARMHAIASIAFNPYPLSTFSGAFFYFSETPHAKAEDCANQASFRSVRPVTTTEQIGGISFVHGSDEHGTVCTEARDNVYTAMHKGACYRFDLVINTFCGGDAGAGARDMTDRQLESVEQRLTSILDTVRFD
jgi:hypothetical protein